MSFVVSAWKTLRRHVGASMTACDLLAELSSLCSLYLNGGVVGGVFCRLGSVGLSTRVLLRPRSELNRMISDGHSSGDRPRLAVSHFTSWAFFSSEGEIELVSCLSSVYAFTADFVPPIADLSLHLCADLCFSSLSNTSAPGGPTSLIVPMLQSGASVWSPYGSRVTFYVRSASAMSGAFCQVNEEQLCSR